ncbi:MAG: DNA repair protein RecO [Candidatus Dojkabacteria bacterium]
MRKSDQGIVLRVSPLKESDAIITILGKNLGKVRAYAKGVLSKKSRRRSHFELLNIISFDFQIKGDEEQGFLGKSEFVSEAKVLRNEQHFFAETFLVAEVVNALYDNQEQIFNELAEVSNYKSTGTGSAKLELVSLVSANYLLLRLLAISGFIHDLSFSVENGKKIDQDKGITYSADTPGYVQSRYGSVAPRQIKLQNGYLKCSSLRQAIKLASSKEEQMKLLKLHISWLELVLGRELKSKYLVNSIK